MKKYSHSFEIALSAISCAVAVVLLLVGFWSNILLASGYLFAMVALMVPLSKQFYKGGVLAYLGTVYSCNRYGRGCTVLGSGSVYNVFRAPSLNKLVAGKIRNKQMDRACRQNCLVRLHAVGGVYTHFRKSARRFSGGHGIFPLHKRIYLRLYFRGRNAYFLPLRLSRFQITTRRG